MLNFSQNNVRTRNEYIGTNFKPDNACYRKKTKIKINSFFGKVLFSCRPFSSLGSEFYSFDANFISELLIFECDILNQKYIIASNVLFDAPSGQS